MFEDKSYVDVFNQCVEDRCDTMDYDRHSEHKAQNAAKFHLQAVDEIVTKFHEYYALAEEVEDYEDMQDLRISFVDVFLNEVDALPWHESRETQKINMQAVDRLFSVIESYVHDFHELAAIEDTFREKQHQVQGQIDYMASFPKEDKSVNTAPMHEMVAYCKAKVERLTKPAEAAKNAHFMKLSPFKH